VIVSIQGVKGSFHEEAAVRLFNQPKLLERDTFEEVFTDTIEGHADFSIIAIENSIVGSLIYNYDKLAKSSLFIVAETYLKISHCLIGLPGTTRHDIDEIWSHPMAIEQCRMFLSGMKAKIVSSDDTAGSVERIMRTRAKNIAAIASARSAQMYGAHIIQTAIETDPHNYTRFLVLSRDPELRPANQQNSKTSIIAHIDDKPGSLYELLGLIKAASVNLSKIESRPRIGMPWKYDFYLDLDLDASTPKGQDILKKIADHISDLKLLGTYPRIGDLTPDVNTVILPSP
jgi:prephenate dehydratase